MKKKIALLIITLLVVSNLSVFAVEPTMDITPPSAPANPFNIVIGNAQ